MFSNGLGILGHTYSQRSLLECKLLFKIKLNRFSFFIFLYKYDINFNQPINQHRNGIKMFK